MRQGSSPAAQAALPGVAIVIAPSAGEDDAVIDALASYCVRTARAAAKARALTGCALGSSDRSTRPMSRSPSAAAATRATSEPRLVLRGVCKAYPGVVANDGIDLDVMPGEIHAVLGENGAGKSTLMKVICGVTPPTAGEMRGRAARCCRDPAHARALGIGMVFQHFALFETLSVAENIALTLSGGSISLRSLGNHRGVHAIRAPVDPRGSCTRCRSASASGSRSFVA
jgi:ABC-type glutathione transport system ATPase component